MSTDLYSDYVRREPHPRNAVFIKKWHGKLLDLALKQSKSQPKRVLEIGPGHGYFAEHCRSRGLNYEFCDTSAAVVAKMSALGFHGHLGLVHELGDVLGKYDLIWMSHVLEHSPTWLSAREMIDAGRKHLTDQGFLVVVSPDILSWRHEFWNVDWSHGYPTSIRNVVQLCSDVGFNEINAFHHRNGSKNLITRLVFSAIALAPHRVIDRALTPSRYKVGDGFTYSWKAVFGWRQIFVMASKSQ
jgi:hypothetical protein